MKSLGIGLLIFGLLVALVPADAQGTSFTVKSKDKGGGNFIWVGSDGATENPSFNVDAGASFTITAINDDGGFHALKVGDKKGDDIPNKGDQAVVTFTAPASGSVSYECPYHPSMKGTVTVGTASAATPEKKSPGVELVGISIAIVGAAMLLRRK